MLTTIWPSNEEGENLPLDVRAAALDITEYVVFDDNEKYYIDKVYLVYMYDKNTVTYCCELRPSYDLRFVYVTAVLTAAGHALDAEKKEALYEKFEDTADLQDADTYMHCSGLDAREKKHADDKIGFDRIVTIDIPADVREEEEDEQGEWVMDHMRSNEVFS
jgi:hypothetical protein